jgi:general secretion pathway protein B
MSSVLRALKKLQHDKASRKPDPTDIDLEFLRSPAPAPRRSPLKGALLVGLLLACGSVATYLFMSRAEKGPVARAPVVSQARQAAFMKPTSALPAIQPLANSSSAASPAGQAQQVPAPTPLAVQPPLPAAKTKPESLPRQTPATKPPKAPIRTTPLPSLTVNGLALSDGEKRKAIVNGVSVSVGSVIEGARIEDIQENRVRFSRGGKKFEITVGSTGP